MKEYNFNKSKLNMNISGIDFAIDTGHQQVSKALSDFSQALLGIKTISEAIDICIIAINGILQDENAVRDIFKERNITVDELIDLVDYLAKEITTFKNERLIKYMGVEANTQDA